MKKGFKRRSAMKMLHTSVFSTVVSNSITAGGVIGYLPIYTQLSERYGRNMSQSQTFRVVGFSVQLVNTADALTDVGGSLAVQAQWIAPSYARVAAHETILREFVADVRDDSDHAKGRQLIVAFDSVQAPAAWESILYRGDVPNRVHLLGASSAGNIGVFADWNTKHPGQEGVAGVGQPDQDIHVPLARASQSVDSITGHATLSTSYQEDVEINGGVVTAYGELNNTPYVSDWTWWAPSGTYLPVMCGIMKFIAADSWYPPILPGMAATTGTTVPTRGTMTAIITAFIEGWTPISKK